MRLAIMVGTFVKRDVREWHPSTIGPLLSTMTDSLLALGREELYKRYPPPPRPGTTLRKNQPLVPRSNSRITCFTGVVGFSCFWWM